jgi:hypothetical protein
MAISSSGSFRTYRYLARHVRIPRLAAETLAQDARIPYVLFTFSRDIAYSDSPTASRASLHDP